MMATVSASFCLPYLGRLTDRKPLLPLALCFGGAFALGLTSLYLAQNVAMICLAYFLLRAFGQGSFIMIGVTTITKLFGQHRGKALSLTSLGHPVAQTVFPAIVTVMIVEYGWRAGIGALGVIFLMTFPIIVSVLLKGQDTRSPLYSESIKVSSNRNASGSGSFSAKDYRFYLVSLANNLTPFTLTGLIFLHATLLESKSWDITLYSTGLMVYAISGTCTSFLIGRLIDRLTARMTLLFVLTPLLLGFLILSLASDPFFWYVFMVLIGMAPPFVGTTKSALWAEVYGVQHLGRIRGIDSQFAIMSTAFGPLTLSFLLERGLAFDQLLMGLACLAGLGMMLHAFAALVLYGPREKGQGLFSRWPWPQTK